jgi:hypothetical protein
VEGLENYPEMTQLLTETKSATKLFVEVSSDR